MDLTHIRSLLAVAEQGTVGEAAQLLNLSQSAMSRRLQILEEHFQAELLVRRGRGVVLTEAGRLVESEGKKLVERFDRPGEEVARLGRLESGVVRLGGGATFVGYLLGGALSEFSLKHPDVRFFVREAGSREVEEAVLREELELGVVTEPEAHPDLEVTPLLVDKIVLVAGSQHPFFGRKSVSLSELDGQNLVGFEGGTAIRRLIDSALLTAQVKMRVTMELRSIAAILRLLESSSTLAFVSELGAPAASVLRVRGLEMKRELSLIRKKGRPMSKAAAEFSLALAENIKAHGAGCAR